MRIGLRWAALVLCAWEVSAWAQAPDIAPAPAAAAPDAGARRGPNVKRMPFTKFSIEEVVKFHLPEIQTCYDQVIADLGHKSKPPEGRVTAKFSIMPTGSVSKASVDKAKSTIKDPRIEQCVTDAVTTWSFPEPTDQRETPIEYPFDLKVGK